jgi:hypothetical protein
MVKIPWTVVVRKGDKVLSLDVTAPMSIPERTTHFCSENREWEVHDDNINAPQTSYRLLVAIKGWHSRGSTVFSEGVLNV